MRIFLLITCSLLFTLLAPAGSLHAQTATTQKELDFKVEHRVNAHGDEFNAISISADERRLFIASEKGDVIVWDIAAKRIERKLNQAKPVHLVAVVDSRTVVAAGDEHFGERSGIVRKWDIETGNYVDLPGLGSGFTVYALASEPRAGLIAAASLDGRVIVWDASTNQTVATWELKQMPLALALIGRNVYVGLVSPEDMNEDFPKEGRLVELNLDERQRAPHDFIKATGRAWTELKPSPDGRTLAASFYPPNKGEYLALIDVAGKKERAGFAGSSAAWMDNENLLLFGALDPDSLVRITEDGKATKVKSFERFDSELDGRPFNLTGQVASRDGSRAWSVYRKGGALLEWDLKALKMKPLFGARAGAYALSVLPQSSSGSGGLLMTGGADGVARLWNLADLQLRREFQVADADSFVSDVDLLPDGRRALVAVSKIRNHEEERTVSTTYMLLNLETGEQKKLVATTARIPHVHLVGADFIYPAADRLVLASSETGATKREFIVGVPFARYNISANASWLAVLDATNTFQLFDIKSGRRTGQQAANVGGWSPLSVTNDGLYVYAIEGEGSLTRWDTRANKLRVTRLEAIAQVHSHSDYILLAENDTRLLVAGNHGDIGIFNPESGELIAYGQTSAAATYVEKAWLRGNRLILAIDTGVLLDNTLVESK